MEKQDYKAIRAALIMSYAKPTAIRLLDLIDKPVQTTKEQPKDDSHARLPGDDGDYGDGDYAP